MQIVASFAISLSVVGLFYYYYFKGFYLSRKNVFWQTIFFLAGFFGSSLVFVPLLFVARWLDPGTVYFIVVAAFLEELIKGLLWLSLFRKKIFLENSPALNLFQVMLVALGFSLSENIYYALIYDETLIVLRCVSSVPIHAFASILMGYYLIFFAFSRSKTRRFFHFVGGLLASGLYHALYNYIVLFGQGDLLLFVSLFVLAGYLFTEVKKTTLLNLFGWDILEIIGIDLEDNLILQRTRKIERWIFHYQKESLARPRLWQGGWRLGETFVAVFLAALGLAVMASVAFLPEQSERFFQVENSVVVYLVSVTSISFAIIFLLRGKIHYQTLIDYFLRYPKPMVVQVQEGEVEEDGIVLLFQGKGFFVISVSNISGWKGIGLTIPVGWSQWRFAGNIVWRNMMDDDDHHPSYPFGVMVQIRKGIAKYLILRLVYAVLVLGRKLRFFGKNMFS